MHDDVRTLDALPDAEVVSAGFPCQDLSQAGHTAGIKGEQSGLVDHVFRLISGRQWRARVPKRSAHHEPDRHDKHRANCDAHRSPEPPTSVPVPAPQHKPQQPEHDEE